jgi:nicotinate-nucleotide pyrophosphorylase (carboxylating)
VRAAPPWPEIAAVVARAVDEDLPAGDPTGALAGDRTVAARMVSRAPGTVAGLVAVQPVLDEVARRLGTGRAAADLEVADGDAVAPGQVLARLRGPARTVLAAERTVLNIVTHLSGTATMTAAAVAAVAGTGTVVRDTRKTHAGLRAVEKYAVRCGGGANHRMSLSDAMLVKDNHIATLGGVAPAVAAARAVAARDGLTVEVEVDTLDELDQALAAGAGLVLLDNMGLTAMAEAARRATAAGARVEASGGLDLVTLPAVAATGVHFVAIGALTHSAPALDVGLDWEPGAGAGA